MNISSLNTNNPKLPHIGGVGLMTGSDIILIIVYRNMLSDILV